MITPYIDEQHCCGCGACANACSKNAISMCTNEQGFIYPVIDQGACVDCGLCHKVCAFNDERWIHAEAQRCYGGIDCSLDKSQSSSGGISNALSKIIVEADGVVYGCALENVNDEITPHHIRVDNVENLKKLQGSKYVQSDIDDTYRQVKCDLKNGKQVLFTGTPCQVAGLRSFLRKPYDNLFCIDIICHGIPSKQMFQDSIRSYEEANNGEVVDIFFRDKSKFPALNQKIIYNQKINIRYYTDSLYYTCFLRGDIYRESCYNCPYAQTGRVSDITLGDFWGLEFTNPEQLKDNGGPIDLQQGVSCIIVNSKQGEKLLSSAKGNLYLFDSSIDDIAKSNHQLRHPSPMPSCRSKIFKDYEENGYDGFCKAVVDNYKWSNRKANLKHFIKKILCLKSFK